MNGASSAYDNRAAVMNEIKLGFKLRPTVTVDKSKPIIQAEGEDGPTVKWEQPKVPPPDLSLLLGQRTERPKTTSTCRAPTAIVDYTPPKYRQRAAAASPLVALPANGAPPPPPPPPPLSMLNGAGPPPPPPPPPPGSTLTPTLTPKTITNPALLRLGGSAGQSVDRSALLKSIQGGFQLRSTVTVDKSKPIIQAEGEETPNVKYDESKNVTPTDLMLLIGERKERPTTTSICRVPAAALNLVAPRDRRAAAAAAAAASASDGVNSASSNGVATLTSRLRRSPPRALLHEPSPPPIGRPSDAAFDERSLHVTSEDIQKEIPRGSAAARIARLKQMEAAAGSVIVAPAPARATTPTPPSRSPTPSMRAPIVSMTSSSSSSSSPSAVVSRLTPQPVVTAPPPSPSVAAPLPPPIENSKPTPRRLKIVETTPADAKRQDTRLRVFDSAAVEAAKKRQPTVITANTPLTVKTEAAVVAPVATRIKKTRRKATTTTTATAAATASQPPTNTPSPSATSSLSVAVPIIDSTSAISPRSVASSGRFSGISSPTASVGSISPNRSSGVESYPASPPPVVEDHDGLGTPTTKANRFAALRKSFTNLATLTDAAATATSTNGSVGGGDGKTTTSNGRDESNVKSSWSRGVATAVASSTPRAQAAELRKRWQPTAAASPATASPAAAASTAAPSVAAPPPSSSAKIELQPAPISKRRHVPIRVVPK